MPLHNKLTTESYTNQLKEASAPFVDFLHWLCAECTTRGFFANSVTTASDESAAAAADDDDDDDEDEDEDSDSMLRRH